MSRTFLVANLCVVLACFGLMLSYFGGGLGSLQRQRTSQRMSPDWSAYSQTVTPEHPLSLEEMVTQKKSVHAPSSKMTPEASLWRELIAEGPSLALKQRTLEVFHHKPSLVLSQFMTVLYEALYFEVDMRASHDEVSRFLQTKLSQFPSLQSFVLEEILFFERLYKGEESSFAAGRLLKSHKSSPVPFLFLSYVAQQKKQFEEASHYRQLAKNRLSFSLSLEEEKRFQRIAKGELNLYVKDQPYHLRKKSQIQKLVR